MASSNKTPNYGLSQFLGTDKPAWLADYNADMLAIDTGINGAKSAAQGAQTAAGAADAKADTATSAAEAATATAETAKSTAVAAQQTATNAATTANNATNVANEAKTLAGNAKSAADTANNSALQTRADLDAHETAIRLWSEYSLVGNAALTENSVKFYENSGIGLLQINGTFRLQTATPNGTPVVIGTLPNEVERPSKNIRIDNGLQWVGPAADPRSWGIVTITTTGQISVTSYGEAYNMGSISCMLLWPELK